MQKKNNNYEGYREFMMMRNCSGIARELMFVIEYKLHNKCYMNNMAIIESNANKYDIEALFTYQTC